MKTNLLWVFTLVSHCLFAQELTQSQKSKIDSLFVSWTNSDKPGAAVAVVIGNRLVYKSTFGSADISSKKPLEGHTNFWIASVSKQFTALGVSSLEEAGKLSIDDPVSKYIPELRQFPQVKVKHLLHHRSGLRDGYTLVGMTLRGEKHYDVQSVLAMLSRQKQLNFEPGSAFQYVNSNYVLLALVIERVSGKPFHQFMRTEVFEPLGLKDARIYDGRTTPGDAKGYYEKKGKYKAVKRFIPAVGSSGVLLSLEDAIAFEGAYHNPRKPYILEAMENSEPQANDGGHYRRGVETHVVGGHTVVRHFGSDPGFRADILRLPEQNLSVILFSNANNYWDLGKHLFYIAGVVLDDSALKTFGSPAIDHPAPKEAKAWDGVYVDTTFRSARFIKYENGILKASPSRQGYYKPLKSIAADTFSTQDVYEFTYTFEESALQVAGVEGEHRFNKIDSASFSHQIRHYEGVYYSDELRKRYRITYKHGRLRLSFFRMIHIDLHPIGKDLFYGSFSGDNILQFTPGEAGRHTLLFNRDGIRNLHFRKK